MKLSIVLSTQQAQFQAATFKGDLETNLAQIASLGYEGVELAIRDPRLVDMENLETLIHKYNLFVPAIGTGQAWGEEGSPSLIPIRRYAMPPSNGSRVTSRLQPISKRLLSLG